MHTLIVAGARPNFVKIAPLIRELKKQRTITWKLVHTGQHYDYQMSQSFFEELEIPSPHHHLQVGSGSHAEQTAKIMMTFEKICLEEKPRMVIVVGDVNSTIACAITAKKLHIEVAHIEAGLRSGDFSMPEEVNRVLTDAITDYFFVTEKSAIENLHKEGKKAQHIFFVGNIMIDNLHYGLQKVGNTTKDSHVVITMHRPSNVDDKDNLQQILQAIIEIAKQKKVYFPMHPRTQKKIEEFSLQKLLENDNIMTSPPLSYLEFLRLWSTSSLVITDSGGLQEETTALRIPCLTIRENTERPVTLTHGSNTLVGTATQKILDVYQKLENNQNYQVPELWDGKTAQRIITILQEISAKTSLERKSI
ncbi:non-hydrolyzing UDP-N-acetylglucosamine 2-epimerase [Candidatus Uabimicrobium amorphum]|uniref:UDP-N-acetyl glucosamine 2-epimerase n=1 Tax=Uabimicrobium amorphum TaxID=2596890 RepID=A0A5S9F0N7_UABAM|nr:UDP-N-acetylglucosamine 2-epimerase (non-hydrolyzing) [Candidatus Uabimicrobium amorphum]BBM81696.1 UDP-N-acetyl glucosamine 2-epimerase [Candidatus Uabimicrobium amorphum]